MYGEGRSYETDAERRTVCMHTDFLFNTQKASQSGSVEKRKEFTVHNVITATAQ